MTRVVVLGGCGAVGRVTLRTLARFGNYELVLADIDVETANSLAAALGPMVSVIKVDASDIASVRAAVRGAAVAVNCVGPFYKFARPVLQACVDERVNYVDICDDVDATLDLLSMDAAVKAAGIRALIGIGNSPGVTNVIGRMAAEVLLDEVDAIDICHCHGGEAFEGPGVVAHRLHGMGMDIPVYLEGKLRYVKFFEADGVALREDVDFHLIGKERVYPYPHPEQITMPQHIRCRRVTNRGTVLPQQYFDLTTEVARLSLSGEDPLLMDRVEAVPRDAVIPWLLRKRDLLLRELDFGSQRGCMRVAISGMRGSQRVTIIVSMASQDAALGEGTGIPAAMGAILMLQGKVAGPGVLPPEGAINPLQFLALMDPVLATSDQKSLGSFKGLVVQEVSADGTLTKIKLTKRLIMYHLLAKKLRQQRSLVGLGAFGLLATLVVLLAWLRRSRAVRG